MWAGGAYFNNSLYVIGGGGAAGLDGNSRAVQRFDLNTQSWSYGSPLNVPRQSPATAVVNGYIFTIGGVSNETALGVMEVWNPLGTSGWQNGVAMPVPVAGAACVVANGLIFVIGGSGNSSVPGNLMQIFNPGTGKWATGPAAPGNTLLGSAAFLNNKIYVYGGYAENSQLPLPLMIFDMNSGKWTSVDLGGPVRINGTICTINNRLYVAGGITASGGPDSGERNSTMLEGDPQNLFFKRIPPMLPSMWGAVCCACGNTIVQASGAYYPDFYSMMEPGPVKPPFSAPPGALEAGWTPLGRTLLLNLRDISYYLHRKI